MEPLPEDQQSVGWVKCTIGTVVLCLVFGATLLLTGPFHVQPQFQYVLVLPSMIAAFLIGVHLQTWKWPAAPLVVAIPFVAMGVLGLLMGLAASPDEPGPLRRGGARAFMLSIGGFLTLASLLLALVHAILAAIGVWWGQHRGNAVRSG